MNGETLRDASLSEVRTPFVAPGCLGAKGTSLSESIVLLRLMLGTIQVAVEALGFLPVWGRRNLSASAECTLLFAPHSAMCSGMELAPVGKRGTSSPGPCHMDQFLTWWSGEGTHSVCHFVTVAKVKSQHVD